MSRPLDETPKSSICKIRTIISQTTQEKSRFLKIPPNSCWKKKRLLDETPVFAVFIAETIGPFLCMAVQMGRGGSFEVWWAVGMLCMVQTETTPAFKGGDDWDDPIGLRTNRVSISRSATHNQFEGHNGLKGNGRSEKWQIFLYGDKSMAVKLQCVEVLRSVSIHRVVFFFCWSRCKCDCFERFAFICAGLFDKTCTVFRFSRRV